MFPVEMSSTKHVVVYLLTTCFDILLHVSSGNAAPPRLTVVHLPKEFIIQDLPLKSDSVERASSNLGREDKEKFLESMLKIFPKSTPDLLTP